MAPAAVAASPCATRRQPSAAAAVAAAPPPCRVPPTAARFPQRCPYRRQQRSSTVAASAPEAATTAVSLPEPAAAELDAEGRRAWGACAELLAARCGLDREAANAALLKAFGWKGQGFWRQERVKQAPELQQVATALDFVAGLGISEPADGGKLVTTFPEVLGLKLEVMEGNVQLLKEKWSMKGKVLANSIKRKPRALGNIIDCEGTCAGLCTRCWAQF